MSLGCSLTFVHFQDLISRQTYQDPNLRPLTFLLAGFLGEH